MQGTARFIANFFPLFLLGGVFGKLMDDIGSVFSIARGITERPGTARAIIAVVLACAALTYGGVSLFVVAFAVFPVADTLFRQAEVPHRLIPAAIALGAFTFTMTALPGAPAIQNAIPMATFGTTLFAAPGLGLLASEIVSITSTPCSAISRSRYSADVLTGTRRTWVTAYNETRPHQGRWCFVDQPLTRLAPKPADGDGVAVWLLDCYASSGSLDLSTHVGISPRRSSSARMRAASLVKSHRWQ
jgi:hypothetical protein